MTFNPLISVFAPTFNCEKCVCSLIDSFLAQSYGNFELIIVDDASSDQTVEKIQSYKDSRIKLIRHIWNKGVNAALNTAFENSEGEYISFIGGDDAVKPTYLEKAINEFEKNKRIGALYTSLIAIDELDEIIHPQPLWCTQNQRNRESLLNHMFYNGNALLSPGMIVKKSVLQTFMPLNISLSTYQDYFLHINILLRTDIAFFKEAECYYRRSKTSLSVRKDNHFREELETSILMDTFLQIKDVVFLKEILKNNKINIVHEELIPYYIGISALTSPKIEKQKWGYRTILNFISNEKNYERLHKLNGFSYAKLLNASLLIWSQNKKVLRRKRMVRYALEFSIIFSLLLAIFWSIL